MLTKITSLCFLNFISAVISMESVAMVGDTASWGFAPARYFCPSVHALAFRLLSLFSLRNTNDSRALLFSYSVIWLESWGLNFPPICNCSNFLLIASSPLMQNFCSPFRSNYCVVDDSGVHISAAPRFVGSQFIHPLYRWIHCFQMAYLIIWDFIVPNFLPVSHHFCCCHLYHWFVDFQKWRQWLIIIVSIYCSLIAVWGNCVPLIGNIMTITFFGFTGIDLFGLNLVVQFDSCWDLFGLN